MFRRTTSLLLAALFCLALLPTATFAAQKIWVVPGNSDLNILNGGVMSGSFVVSGSVRARLTRVGKDSYASRLTLASKKDNQIKQSEMMRSLTSLVKWIGIALIPIGAIMRVFVPYVAAVSIFILQFSHTFANKFIPLFHRVIG